MAKFSALTILMTLSLAASASETDLQHQCVVDLCGSEQVFLPVSAKGPFGEVIPLDVRSFLEKQIDPSLEKLFKTSTKSLNLKIQAVGKLIEKSQLDPLSWQLKGVLIMGAVFGKIGPLLDESVTEPQATGIKIAINAEKLSAKIPSLDSHFLNRVIPILNLFLGTEKAAEADGLSSMSFDLFQKAKLSQLAMKDPAIVQYFWNHFANDLKTRLGNLQGRIGTFSFEDLNPSLLAKIGSEKLAEPDKKEIMTLLTRIHSFEALLSPPVQKAIVESKIELSEILTALNWAQKSRELESALASPQVLLQAKKQAMQTCHENIVKAIAAAPSAFRQRKADELMQTLKTAAKTIAPLYFAEADLLSATKAIDNARFAMPAGGDRIRDSISLTFQGAQTRMNVQMTSIQHAIDGDSNWKSMMVRTIGGSSKNVQETLINPIKNLCELFKPAPFEDKALFKAGLIQVGWQSASFGTIGAGVIAHELGHLVSASVSQLGLNSPVFRATRSCSTEQHADLMQKSNALGKADQFQEEDWADSFAATTIKELNKTWPYAQNFACYMIGLDDQNKFKGLDLLSPSGTDVHSTGFYRALQFHISLGQNLPASCELAAGSKLSIVKRSCAQ